MAETVVNILWWCPGLLYTLVVWLRYLDLEWAQARGVLVHAAPGLPWCYGWKWGVQGQEATLEGQLDMMWDSCLGFAVVAIEPK